ncbi:Elongation factor Ts [subsurface metagenome]
MNITAAMVKELRNQSGAGIMQCRKALIESDGDNGKALEILKQQSLFKAAKKAERPTAEGLIETYIHTAGRVGAMVELNCETDFVARTDEFKQLAHHLAMQVAAMNPKFITEEECKPETEDEPQNACLLLQADIKEPDKTIKEIIIETIARTGENIKVSRFIRFELGEQ